MKDDTAAVDRLVSWVRKRPRRNVCRACHRLHQRADVVCGEPACEAWRKRYEAALRAEEIRDGRLT